ncbi:MAG: SPOR domain-containing protein [bacterium]
MKIRHAIGITINGNEVRAAFLSLVRGKARIKALESIKLDAPLDRIRNPGKTGPDSLNDLENAFEIQEPKLDPDEAHSEESNEPEHDKTVSQIYSLLDKFQHIKANVAINSPHLTVKYDVIEEEHAPQNRKKRLKERMEIWRGDNEEARRTNYIDISDSKILQVDYEHHPPIIDLIEEVNQFRASNLNLVLMDTNELALVDLVKEIYKFDKDEITAIIYIEQDFSRVIFLKGRDIYHITPIVHKGSMSKDVLEVIYSKMIFAQDHYFIPELNKILVAGHSSRLKAKYYFRQKFPSAVTGYLNSKKIQSDLRFKDRGLLFSRYAVPIALAWKALLKRSYKAKNKNLLPEYILERQTMPKLAVHGYIFMFLLAASAFSFTWALVVKNIELRKITTRIKNMQTQIDDNKSLTERVHSFDDQIVAMERKIALVDSFSTGYDETMKFLQLLNRNVPATGSIWLTELKKSDNQISLTGMAKRRDKIPHLATSIGGANLKKVTRSGYEETNVFLFNLEKELDAPEKKEAFDLMTFLRSRSGKSQQEQPPAQQVALAGTTAGNGASKSTNGVAHVRRAATKMAPQDLVTNGQQGGASKKPESKIASAANGRDSVYVFGLQIGSFDSSKAAALESKKFKKRGYAVKISRRNPRAKESKYALVVGAFIRYNDAQKLSELLASESGIDNTIIKYKKRP